MSSSKDPSMWKRHRNIMENTLVVGRACGHFWHLDPASLNRRVVEKGPNRPWAFGARCIVPLSNVLHVIRKSVVRLSCLLCYASSYETHACPECSMDMQFVPEASSWIRLWHRPLIKVLLAKEVMTCPDSILSSGLLSAKTGATMFS